MTRSVQRTKPAPLLDGLFGFLGADPGRSAPPPPGRARTICDLRHDLARHDPLPWSWARPTSGSQIAPKIRLFHDAPARSPLEARGQQVGDLLLRGDPEGEAALTLISHSFPGSYVSLALDLTPDGSASLPMSPDAQLITHLDATATRPLAVHLRLNRQMGEDVRSLHQALILTDSKLTLPFALDALPQVGSGTGSLWLDVIFAKLSHAEVGLRALTCSVSPIRTAA